MTMDLNISTGMKRGPKGPRSKQDRKPTPFIAVRFTHNQMNYLRLIASNHGVFVAEIIRRAVMNSIKFPKTTAAQSDEAHSDE